MFLNLMLQIWRAYIIKKKQVIIPITWLKWRGFKDLIRDELYAGRKLYFEIFKTGNLIVLLSNDYCVDF